MIALTWISFYFTDDKSILVPIMDLVPSGSKQLSEQMSPKFMSTYGVTRPQMVNKLLLFSQHCFLSHSTPQYPQLTCLSTQPLYSHWHICFLCHLLIFHNNNKKHFNLLSSITKPLLTHIIASLWRKQSCYPMCFALSNFRLPNFGLLSSAYHACVPRYTHGRHATL